MKLEIAGRVDDRLPRSNLKEGRGKLRFVAVIRGEERRTKAADFLSSSGGVWGVPGGACQPLGCLSFHSFPQKSFTRPLSDPEQTNNRTHVCSFFLCIIV